MKREDHCTHPEQTWCDCDWCRVIRANDEVAALSREYLEMSRASFDRLFGHNAKARRKQIGAALLARGITQIPNIFGPINVEG